MSTESSLISRAVTELLEANTAFFQQDISARAQANFAAQEALDTSVEPINMLGNEALTLMDNMAWLQRHRFIGRLASERAVNVIKTDYDGLATTPLFSSQAEYISTDKGSDYISDTYVFTVDTMNLFELGFRSFRTHGSGKRRTLTIKRELVGEESKLHSTVESWSVVVEQDGDDGVRDIDFYSTRTDDYRSNNQEIIFSRYEKDNPWLTSWKMFFVEKGFRATDFIRTTQPNERKYAIERDLLSDLEAFSPEGINKSRIIDELQRDLKRGNGWDYSEKDYYFAFGLMQQAHSQLIKRQILPKLIK